MPNTVTIWIHGVTRASQEPVGTPASMFYLTVGQSPVPTSDDEICLLVPASHMWLLSDLIGAETPVGCTGKKFDLPFEAEISGKEVIKVALELLLLGADDEIVSFCLVQPA